MRLQVNVNEEMLKKIDKYCGMMAVSRSALCGMLIGQGLMGLDQSLTIVGNIGTRLGDSLVADKILREVADGIENSED